MKNFKIFALIFIISIAFNIKINHSLAAFGIDEKIKQVKTADNPAIYFLDHKRGLKKAYVNEEAFMVYGNKWSDVKVIAKEQLDKWPSLELVKTAESPSVFFIKNGKKVNIENEADFKKLGFEWNKIATIQKDDLEQYALVSYGELGLNIGINEFELLKIKNRPAIYYVKNKMKTPIVSAADFEKFGFDWDEVIEVEKEDLDDLTEADYKKAGLDSILTAKAKLSAALDPSSPKGLTNLPIGTNGNLIGVYNFNSEGGVSQITGLNFGFKGIFSEQILGELYLTNENKVNYDITPSRTGKNINFNFKENPIIIGSGQKKKINVYADLSACPGCPKVNLQLSLAKVLTEESQSKFSSVLPIDANSFYLVDASSVLAQAELNEIPLNKANSEAVIGQSGQTVMNFNIKETSGNEDIYVNNLSFEMQGSLTGNQIDNFVLKDKDKKIISRATSLDKKQLLFNLNKYKISRKTEATFSIVADISDGEAQNFDFKAVRADITGATNEFGVKTKIANISESIKVVRKDVGVVSKPLTASKLLFSKKKGSLISVFEIRNTSEEIYLDSLTLSIARSSGAPELNKEVYLVNYNTGEVLSQVSGSSLAANPAEFRLNNLQLKAKSVLTVALITEMPKIEKSGLVYRAIVKTLQYRTKSNLLLQNKNSVDGTAFTAISSKLFAYANPDFSETFTKGQTKIKIASFYIESSADDSLNITSLSIDKGGAEDFTYNNGFSNLSIYFGSKKMNTIERPDKSAITIDTNYKLAAERRLEISVYADASKDLKVDKMSVKLAGLTAESYTSRLVTETSGIGVVSNPVIFSKASAKIDSISVGKIVSGSKNNVIASYGIKNNSQEDINLNYITIASSGSGLSYGSGYTNLRLVNTATNKKFGGSSSKPVASANRLKMGIALKPDQELNFSFYVDAVAVSGNNNFNIYISGLEATGLKSKVAVEVVGLPTREMNIAAQ